jgi:hypothetical protein
MGPADPPASPQGSFDKSNARYDELMFDEHADSFFWLLEENARLRGLLVRISNMKRKRWPARDIRRLRAP